MNDDAKACSYWGSYKGWCTFLLVTLEWTWTSHFSLQDLKIFIRHYHLTPSTIRLFIVYFTHILGSLETFWPSLFSHRCCGSRSLWCFPFAREAAQCARAVGDFVAPKWDEWSEPEFFVGVFSREESDLVNRQLYWIDSYSTHEQWTKPWLFRVFTCFYCIILPICIGNIINHYKDPYSPTSISWKVGVFFCGSHEIFRRCTHNCSWTLLQYAWERYDVFKVSSCRGFKCIAGITYTLMLTRSDWVITSSSDRWHLPTRTGSELGGKGD